MGKVAVKVVILTVIFLLAEIVQAIVIGIAGSQGVNLMFGGF